MTDVGRAADGSPYLIMEYLNGEDCARLLRRHGSLAAPRALNIVVQACRGLAVGHRAAIVHRDLKPGGIEGNPNFAEYNGDHTCALKSDGTVVCWGDNRFGEIGDGTTVNKTVPTLVPNLCNVTAIAAGYYHTCALHPDGTASCWGHNASGDVGAGSTATQFLAPTAVARLTTAVAIAAGRGFTCALKADSTVACWGLDTWDQLGDGTTTNALFPVAVENGVVF